MSPLSKKVIAAAGMLGFLATAGVAFAQSAPTTAASAAVAQSPILQIGPSGKTLLRGTIVSAASGSLTVKSWGGEWTVSVPASASVLPQGTALSSFQTGDFVGVQGTVDGTAAWTVDATLVRDWTARAALTQQIKTNAAELQQVMAAGPRNTQGTLSALNASAQSFTLTTGNGTAYAVTLNPGALLLASNRATLSLSQVSNGDTVRVYGPVSSSTIAASVFRDVSVK